MDSAQQNASATPFKSTSATDSADKLSARKRQKGKDITKCPDYLTLPKAVTEDCFGEDLGTIHEQDVEVVYVVNNEQTSAALGRIFKNSAHKGKSYEYRLRGGVKELCEKLLSKGWDKLTIMSFKRVSTGGVGGKTSVVMQLKAYRQQDEDAEDSQTGKKRKRTAKDGGYDADAEANGQAVMLRPQQQPNLLPLQGPERQLLEAILKGDSDQVSQLLQSGVSPEVVFDQDGHTPLMLAADKGLANICQLLITSGAAIDAANKYGDTSLLLAAHQGNLEVCKVLISNGANLGAGNRYGDTALLLAAIKKHDDVCKLLLESGFDVNSSNQEGQTALHMAVEKGHDEVAKLLISCEANVNITDKAGYTPMMFAASTGNEEMVKLLYERGAEMNARHPVEGAPLVQAAAKGQHHVCRALVALSADVNAMNQSDQTALMFASRDGDFYTCQLYITQGTEVNAADKVGTTAMMIAASRGRADICRLLLQSGANMLMVDKDGKSAYCHAKAQGYAQLAEELSTSVTFQAAAWAKDNKQQLFALLTTAAQNDNFDYCQLVLSAAGLEYSVKGLPQLAAAGTPDPLLQLLVANQRNLGETSGPAIPRTTDEEEAGTREGDAAAAAAAAAGEAEAAAEAAAAAAVAGDAGASSAAEGTATPVEAAPLVVDQTTTSIQEMALLLRRAGELCNAMYTEYQTSKIGGTDPHDRARQASVRSDDAQKNYTDLTQRYYALQQHATDVEEKLRVLQANVTTRQRTLITLIGQFQQHLFSLQISDSTVYQGLVDLLMKVNGELCQLQS